MQNPLGTIICFDYGRYYMKDGAEIKWISGDGEGEDEIHTIVLKKSVEEVTYSALVERICRKIKVDESKMEAKLSYFPMVLYSNKPSYIWNDEDIFGYLLQFNHENCRSILHVEFNYVEADVNGGLPDREATYIEATDIEATDTEAIDTEASDTAATDNECTGGVLTFYEDIEMHENVTERDENVFEDTEARPSVEVAAVVYHEWEDGMDLVLGQEFRTKEAAKVHIQTTSHLKCFEYDVIKSDTKRYVIRCRGAKEGCKWFVRLAKLINSDLWTLEVTSSSIDVLLLLQEHCLIEGEAHHKLLHLFWIKIIPVGLTHQLPTR
ncbi:hypothetical protein N665_0743s0003 [Sinapis alba]|nr:hypothetical protein N665_0743s0003 [Sinapis alba]